MILHKYKELFINLLKNIANKININLNYLMTNCYRLKYDE